MQPHLDRKQTDDFIASSYAGLKWPCGRLVLEHAWDMGDIAARLLQRQLGKAWGNCPPPAIASQIEEMRHAGLLHAAMDRCAANFEKICELTNLEVAKMLGSYSADSRRPEPQRVLERVGRLADGKLMPQLLMLADVLCTTRYYTEWLKQDPGAELAEQTAHELEIYRILLNPLTEVRDCSMLVGWWQKARDETDTLTKRCRDYVRAANLAKRIEKKRLKDQGAASCPKQKI